MVSVNRTTYVPFWTFGTDRYCLSYWPNEGWCWSRRAPEWVQRARAIYIPGLVIWL